MKRLVITTLLLLSSLVVLAQTAATRIYPSGGNIVTATASGAVTGSYAPSAVRVEVAGSKVALTIGRSISLLSLANFLGSNGLPYSTDSPAAAVSAYNATIPTGTGGSGINFYSQLPDRPTKLSDFSNDVGYVKDTSGLARKTAVTAAQSTATAARDLATQTRDQLGALSGVLVTNKLVGKTVNWLGNSLIAGQSVTHAQTWSGIIATRNNMTERNYGVAGTTVGVGTSNTAGNYLSRYSAMNNQADYVIIEGGTNDTSSGVPVGDPSDTGNSTFYGALKALCSGVVTKYPAAKIGFVTPMNFSQPGEAIIFGYVEAIKEVCGDYGIAVLDLYRNSGLSSANSAQSSAYFIDSIHPNAAGHLKLADKVEAWMLSL